MKVILVHGIHATRKPATSQLAPYVKEYLRERFLDGAVEIEVHKYGYALALPRFIGNWANNRRAAALAKRVKNCDVIVGHSNGCTLGYLVQRDHRRLSGLFLLQPALDNDVAFTGTDHVMVVYNERDDVVEQSRLARFSAWGNMGRVGYKGPSENVRQIDSMSPEPIPPLPYSGHCGFVENGEAVLRSWGREVGRFVEELLMQQQGVKNG